MKRRFLWALGVLLALLVCAGTSSAQYHRSGAFTVAPMIGGYSFDTGLDLDDDAMFGLNLGYNITDRWSAELNGLYVGTEADTAAAEDVDFYQYGLSFLYHYRVAHRLLPFLAVGAALAESDPDIPVVGSSQKSMFTYGAGLKFFLNDTFALRGEVRHNMFFDEEQDNNYFYAAGLHMQFGGYPEVLPPRDSDGDGVTDNIDRCPDTPKGVQVDAYGCPPEPEPVVVPPPPPAPAPVVVLPPPAPLDSDGDGVIDPLDKCPDTPKGVMVDKDGCPVSYTLHIEFDFDKADIKPKYEDDLAKAADFIRRNPAATILVAGHTDSVGTDAYNQKLSERRAQAVRDHLVGKLNIDGSNLAVRGYGETRPIADNSTEEGRAANRRVEIVCCYVLPD